MRLVAFDLHDRNFCISRIAARTTRLFSDWTAIQQMRAGSLLRCNVAERCICFVTRSALRRRPNKPFLNLPRLRCGRSGRFRTLQDHHHTAVFSSAPVRDTSYFLLKGRFHGQESKKASRLEFQRSSRTESDGAQEDACRQNRTEAAPH